MPDPRPYDLVLLGATGFTGRLTAEHLARRLAGTDRSWAIAGRSPDKLRDVAAALPGTTPATEVVDVDDHEALTALARRTRVLASTVGPYARYGEPVVAAAVAAGAHYADITGEPGFVADLRDHHHDAAVAAGVKLVSCCGFDSVPHDLGVLTTVDLLPDDAPLTVRGYVEADARFSGGTAASALEAIGSRQLPRSRPEADPVRETRLLPQRVHRIDAPVELPGYGVPLPTIDPAIVRRSAQRLDGYGERFRYGHFARVRSLPVVVGGAVGLGVVGALAQLGPTRRLLARALPSSGEGPSPERRARSSFAVTFVGSGGGQQVVTRVSGGDPGYDETAKMLGEAALTLASDEGPDVAGAVTPAVGLGRPYLARLRDQGLRFEVLLDGGR
ncbi:saccharopine dehydrogenase [Nitriliruptoraceae bacterium ZYF776]|nr:saccharopine dehydrogenase [Profundirhabdus halotolerans]